MSALVELQERVQKTNALIAECESSIAQSTTSPPFEVVTNLRTLEKLRKRLESQYLETAQSLDLEVYRYRLLPQDPHPKLSAVAASWAGFEEFFTSVYDSLKRTKKAKSSKKAPQSESISLGYGYAFSGSIGVVVTVPREQGLFAVEPLQAASQAVFDLIEAKDVQHYARELGPKPIQSLHRWMGLHVANNMGLGLEWKAGHRTVRVVELQVPQLIRNQETIAESRTTSELEVLGELFAVNDDTKEFQFRADDGTQYAGTFTDVIGRDHAASVPCRYLARIRRVSRLVSTEGKEERTEFLVRLDPPAPRSSGPEVIVW